MFSQARMEGFRAAFWGNADRLRCYDSVCVCVCVSLYLCSFSPQGALNTVRHPVYVQCVISKGVWHRSGQPPGLVKGVTGAERNVILWALWGACHLPNQYLPAQLTAPSTHTHKHTITAISWWWWNWQLHLEEVSLNICLCLCYRSLQFNGWQVEAKEGQSTWTRFRRWTDTYSRPMTVCSVSNRWGGVEGVGSQTLILYFN